MLTKRNLQLLHHAYSQRLRKLWKLPASGKWGAVKRAMRKKPEPMQQSSAFDQKAWHAYYWPGLDFVPKRVNATILEFKIQRQPYYYVRDPLMGWAARTTGRVETHNIKAKHLQILREPWVRNLGQALRDSLRRAQNSNQPPPSSPA